MAKARIIEIKASGAVVLLDGNEKAWLPAQELSVHYIPTKKLALQDLCSEGQELEVAVYGRELGGKRKLVSHIRFAGDPWNKVKEWKDGDVKEMEIHAVTASRAYGRIESGIEGFVELSELYKEVRFPRSWKNFKILRAGDVIAGCVNTAEIDARNRLVKLNAAEYFKNAGNIPRFLPIAEKNSSGLSQKEAAQNPERRDWLMDSTSEIQRILVVDDSGIFLDEIASYLKGRGIEVTTASSKSEVNNYLSHPDCPDFDAAVLDVNLAHTNDYIGFQVAKAIARHQPRCKIIMVTGDRFDSQKMFKVAGNLYISNFLYKPFGIEELNRAISFALAGKPKKLEDFFGTGTGQTGTPAAVPGETRPLTSVVSELKEEIAAEAVTLFSIHPLSYEVRIEEHRGIFRDRAEDFLEKMRYSPVRDVAMEKEIIFEPKISHTSKYSKHRWLVRALKYESCTGFPVHAPGELKYCLFAFHGNEDHFDEMDRFKVKAAAAEIARVLEIQKLQETIRSENPFYLAGKTYGSMAHDLVEALNREFGLPAVFKIIDGKTAVGAEEIKNIKGHLETFRDELRRARGIVKTFRRMSRSQHEKETEVDVFDTVEKVVGNIKIETGAHNTEITVHPMAQDIPGKVRMIRAACEQVLYNLLLNASQQIQRFSFVREQGAIAVAFAKITAKDENKHRLQILIHDSGPGIHARDFERIFQKGYTTKEDGCGMGLDICRNILKQAGGTVRVLKSTLFCGTTFEIRLPFNNNTENLVKEK